MDIESLNKIQAGLNSLANENSSFEKLDFSVSKLLSLKLTIANILNAHSSGNDELAERKTAALEKFRKENSEVFDFLLQKGLFEPSQLQSEISNFSELNIKQVQYQEDGVVVSFQDGGVVALIDNQRPSVMIGTVQAKGFRGYYLSLKDADEFKAKLSEDFGKKSSISSIEIIEVDDYSRHKEFVLSNGINVKINTHGVVVDDQDYFTHENFISECKELLDEDAYFEFNKYTVKQDTGDRLINPFNLDVNDIKIDDIVTALSGINRFAGQTKLLKEDILSDSDFYTVGQHTLAMYSVIKNNPELVGLENASDEYCSKLAKMALSHESYEGLTGTDLITPFKYATKKNEYKTAETEAEEVMEKAFGLPLMNKELKKIDKAMAATEGYYLVGNKNVDWSSYGKILPQSVLKTNMTQKEVQRALTEAFEEEGISAKLEDYKHEYNSRLTLESNDKIFNKKLDYLKGKFKENSIDYNEKGLVFLARQRFSDVSVDLDGISIRLDNSAVLNIDRGFNVNCFNGTGSVEIDLDDFMISQNFSELTRLDYNEYQKACGQVREFESKALSGDLNEDRGIRAS